MKRIFGTLAINLSLRMKRIRKHISVVLTTVFFLTSTLFAAPASAHAATLELNSITAELVSSGVDSKITGVIEKIAGEAVEYGLPVIAGTFTGPGGAFLGAVGGQVAKYAIGEIDNISKSIGRKFPDELYITINGKKVWPTNEKYENFYTGDKKTLNLKRNLTTGVKVVLHEHDTISSDDNLGEYIFSGESESGEYMLSNPEEGDVYFLDVTITL